MILRAIWRCPAAGYSGREGAARQTGTGPTPAVKPALKDSIPKRRSRSFGRQLRLGRTRPAFFQKANQRWFFSENQLIPEIGDGAKNCPTRELHRPRALW